MLKKLLKAIKEPKKILFFLESKGLFNFLPDKSYLKLFHKLNLDEKLDLVSPKTFNQKLQWLKLYDRKDIYTTMVDKYEAKNFVTDIIGEKYIIPTLGVWEKFEDIDFNSLPDQFVLKCTHDSGGLAICRDKKTFDLQKAKQKINKSLRRNYFYNGREWPYKNVKPRIIAEAYMQDANNESLRDYKFYCFNGKIKYLYISEGLEDHSTARISFLTPDWQPAPFNRSDFAPFEEIPPMPKQFEKMKELSEQFAKDFAFIRVDLYEINGELYFSEFTFSPCSGYMPFAPREWDEKLGEMLDLTNL